MPPKTKKERLTRGVLDAAAPVLAREAAAKVLAEELEAHFLLVNEGLDDGHELLLHPLHGGAVGQLLKDLGQQQHVAVGILALRVALHARATWLLCAVLCIFYLFLFVCVYVCACVCMCVLVCEHVCVCVRARACVHACVSTRHKLCVLMEGQKNLRNKMAPTAESRVSWYLFSMILCTDSSMMRSCLGANCKDATTRSRMRSEACSRRFWLLRICTLT